MFRVVYLILSWGIVSTIYSDNSPISFPIDDKEYQKMVQEQRAKLKDEASNVKILQSQRASDFIAQESENFATPMKIQDEILSPNEAIENYSKKASNQPNKVLEKIKIPLPDDEKDKYEIPTL